MKTLISDYLLYPPNLPDEHIRALTGALKNGLFIDRPIPYDKFADITYESEFNGLEKPNSSIIKMSKKEHVDSFFKNGTLQLGTFEYYRNQENEEVKDIEEGSTILVGSNSKNTAVVTITGGFDHYTFCCFDGDADPEIIRKFDYDSYFEIVDPVGFQQAIAKKLNAVFTMKSQCIYKNDKVLVSQISEEFNFGVLSSHMETLGDISKFYIKNKRFAHQNEFRFTWKLSNDIDKPIIMDFPEAIKFCKK
ncbi:hypothetical protein [Flavobacterium sp.]|jgi:hypothetical protein|uniref:hypothetical protein n=1 Tax=Flavobacterium sp. TaxID=239 RepID=UPI003F6A17CC